MEDDSKKILTKARIKEIRTFIWMVISALTAILIARDLIYPNSLNYKLYNTLGVIVVVLIIYMFFTAKD